MARIFKANGTILTGNRIRGFKREIVSISVDGEYATVHFASGKCKANQYRITDADRLLEWAERNGISTIDTRINWGEMDEMLAIDEPRNDPDPEGTELAQLELRFPGY